MNTQELLVILGLFFIVGASGLYLALRYQKQQMQMTLHKLCQEALLQNNQLFLDLAQTSLGKFQETAQQDLQKRQQSIDHLMQPIKSSLEKFDQKIEQLEHSRVRAYTSLTEQIKSLLESELRLKQETSNLVKALRQPQVRGRWGEIQLQKVMELAGMQEHCDFQQQQSQVGDHQQRLRPDLIVRLPGNKQIIIDAKTPLNCFLDALEETDAERQREKMIQHAQLVKSHIQALSSKNYWSQFQPTPEFVVLFLPGEVFFSAALEQQPDLIEHGVERQVLLATPTTLIALLKAIAYGWRQENLAQNTQQIANLGKELAKRLQDMHENFSDVGQKLKKTVETYNKTLGSYESRVLVTARRFQEINGGETQKLMPPEPIEIITRTLQPRAETIQPAEME